MLWKASDHKLNRQPPEHSWFDRAGPWFLLACFIALVFWILKLIGE